MRHHIKNWQILPLIAIVIMALPWFPTSATADGSAITKSVDTGKAIIQGENIDGARQNAIKDALRQALEQAVGMVMQAQSYVVNDDLKEKIYAHSKGYITGYEVLKEGREADGEYRVVLEASVDNGEIKKSLELGLICDQMDCPRILLLPSPKEAVNPATEQAATELIRQFTDRKFELVDPEMSSRLHEEARELLKTDTLENTAARIGLKHQAEIVVVYSVIPGRGEFDGAMETISVTLTAKAVVTTTAQILTAQEETRTGGGKSQDLARRNGAKKSGEAVAGEVMEKIVSWWSDYIANGIPYTITLKTPERADRMIMAFEQAIESVPGVVSLSERSSGGGITEMMVKYKGSSTQFKREIFAATENRRGFEDLHTEASKGRFLVFSVGDK